jgi:sugar phosphate isomerase/epimerase
MRIGVYSDSLPKLSRTDLFAWCAERAIADIELGVGAWGPWPRPHLDIETIGGRSERERLAAELRDHGLLLSAVNAAGNVLHPDQDRRNDAQRRLRAAIEFARFMKVDRVITMSGCPAGPGGGSLGVFPCWATSSDDERLFEWQMANVVGPYWQEMSNGLAREAPGMMICLELHPGVTVFSAKGFEILSHYVGDNIGLNFDPSHFWWQGIDPLTIIEAHGTRIGHAHGKDTLLHYDRIHRDGVLHFAPPAADPSNAPWHFAPVGEGHDIPTWVTLLHALRRGGYNGVISIEHEDPRYDGEEGTERSMKGLRKILGELETNP